jgi:hypothetical protein
MDELRKDVVRRFAEKLASGWTLDRLDAARGTWP